MTAIPMNNETFEWDTMFFLLFTIDTIRQGEERETILLPLPSLHSSHPLILMEASSKAIYCNRLGTYPLIFYSEAPMDYPMCW